MEIELLEVLKWIGIVLAAGFIGYFGRYLAMLIIEKIRKSKTPEARLKTANKRILTRMSKQVNDSNLQFEKKKAKIEAKAAKKALKEKEK